MKKISLLAAAICLAACSKDAEKIDPLKAELIKDYGKTQEEVDSYSYSVHDANAKEVHSVLSDKYLDLAQFYLDYDNLEKSDQALRSVDSLEKAMPNDKDKKYYVVHAYQLRDNDSIFNVYYYLDAGNKLVAVKDLNKKKKL